MNPSTSFLSQTWFPEVRRSTPNPNSSSATEGVIPNPAAAFSALAMVRTTPCSRFTADRCWATCSRPGFPTISPMNRTRIAPHGGRDRRRRPEEGAARPHRSPLALPPPAPTLLGVLDRPRLPDDGHLHLARVV